MNAEHTGHLAGLAEQMLDLVVASTQGVSEPPHPVEGGTEVRRSLVDRVGEYLQRLLDGCDVPAGCVLGGVAERVVDLIGGCRLAQRYRRTRFERVIAARV